MRALLARGFFVTAVLALGIAGRAGAAPSDQYVTHALTSNDAAIIPADHVDRQLVNPWGLVSSPTSPWWTSDNGTGFSTLYNALGVQNTNVLVSVPTPTGIVWNGTPGAFPITGGVANFIFDSENGGIYAWRSGATALLQLTKPGAIYKGLAIATPAGGTPQLYATDFHDGAVDIYSSTWQLVSSSRFVDPTLPAGYAPYGIQAIGSRIFVTFAQQDADAEDEIPGAGKGYVSVFDTAGTFIARVGSTGVLNAPWGVATAPATFGPLGGDLLVGNFGDGRINAFKETSPGTFAPDGTMQSASGPLEIGGLWALEFGAGGASNGPTDWLFYTAGPNGETAGVLGRITANPTLGVTASVPATLSLALGAPASFGPLTPAAGKDYIATAPATVISTAGDAALSVVDPSTTAPGHLVNGTFSLPQPVQAQATSTGGTGSAAYAPVGAAPTTLLTYNAPVSNDAVTLGFKQTIGATDALRTGAYSKTLTFTLSTTNP